MISTRKLGPALAPVAAAIAVVLPPAGVLAQTAANPIDEIVVTSTKLGKSLTELTQSVTILTEDDISTKAYSDFTEVLRHQAGIEFKQAGGPGQFNYPIMRGFANTSILVVVDGVKINEASSGGVGHLLGQIDPASIERIEILRGPQAVLYGANSTAGVISITTKSGKEKTGGISMEAGSLAWRRAGVSLRNTVQAGEGDFAYSVNLSKTDSDNVHPHEFTRDETIQASLGYDTERFGAGISVWRTDNVFQYAELDEASGGQTHETWWAFQTPDPNQMSPTKDTVIGAHLRHEISDRWSQRFQVGSMKKTYDILDAADGLLGYQPAPYDDFRFPAFGGELYARGELIPIYDTATDIAAYYSNDSTQLDYNLLMDGERVGALFGVEYLDQSAAQHGSYGVSSNDESVRSFYANGEVEVGGPVSLALGVRSDDYDSWGRETTGNIGVAIELGSATTLFSNFGTSFVAPSMSQLFNPTYGVLTLQPQSGETVELGVRHRGADGRLSLEAGFWHSDVDNVIAYDGAIPNPRSTSGFGQYTNRDKQRTQGVEFQWSYGLTDAISLSGNYTYTESESKAAGGEWIPTVLVAKHKGNVGAQFSADKFNVGANAYYAGPRLRWAGDLENEAYWRLDASGRFEVTRGLSLFARIENVLDEDIQEDMGYLQPGRYSVVGLQYKFF